MMRFLFCAEAAEAVRQNNRNGSVICIEKKRCFFLQQKRFVELSARRIRLRKIDKFLPS